jgi:hypothetical protein
MAAAVCLAPQALADPAPAHAAAHSATAKAATVVDAASYAGLSPAELLATVQRASGKNQAAKATSYTVRSGDSLSSIAGKVYHKQNAWPVLYYANRHQVHWADIVSTGQVLKVPALPAKIPAGPAQTGPAPAPAPAPAAAPASGPVQATSAVSGGTYSGGTSSGSTYSGGSPGGSFGSCVIARESGGNSQVMNSSGHYGLYQFSESTWVAYGGSAADFGHASVSEQNQVFGNAIARGGQSNWSPYDGC